MMPKILYDSQVFSWQKVGGISRYFVELIQHFDADVEVELPLFYSNNIYLNFNNNNALEKILSKDFFGRDRIISFLNNKKVERKIKQNNFDVFHPTYFDPYFIQHLCNKPYVITVHDMIPENFPENFPNSELLVSNKKKLIYGASKIVGISNATKNEILKHYSDIDQSKIEVIYHGSNFVKVKDTNLSVKLPSEYILFVGQRDGYKNFSRFLRAFKDVNKTIPQLYLVCTGPKFSDNELNLMREYNLQNRILHFFCSDTELMHIYKNAKTFIFPSLEEGFGLPLLEAMGAGCPIICSDIPCFREIADDAARYFNPEDEGSIQDVIIQSFYNVEATDAIVRLGYKRFGDFSWNTSAMQLSNLYKSLI